MSTTTEAAEFLRYRTASGIRTAVSRGRLVPFVPFGAGPRGTYLFTEDELVRFVRGARYAAPALKRVGTRMMLMRQQGQKTRYPGVYRVDDNSYRVRAVATDPRTGKKKAVEKLYEGVSAQEAARMRPVLVEEISTSTRVVTKQRVSDFAKSWVASKAVSLDATTASMYVDALEQHALPSLGDYWYDALIKADVQKWVHDCFTKGWKTPRDGRSATRGARSTAGSGCSAP
jgi:hypothetical protein